MNCITKSYLTVGKSTETDILLCLVLKLNDYLIISSCLNSVIMLCFMLYCYIYH